jgi:hypothetical protein
MILNVVFADHDKRCIGRHLPERSPYRSPRGATQLAHNPSPHPAREAPFFFRRIKRQQLEVWEDVLAKYFFPVLKFLALSTSERPFLSASSVRPCLIAYLTAAKCSL